MTNPSDSDPPAGAGTPEGAARAGRDRGRRSVVVGLTGGQAAGKSSVLARFAERGVPTLSADAVVARLYEGGEVRGALAEAFGSGVLTPGGDVDRAALRARTRDDEGALDRLEALLHPLVDGEVRRWIDELLPGAVGVVEIPLLFEADLAGLFDLVVTVEAPASVRRLRAQGREGAALFDRFEARQLRSEERRRRADLVFVNDGDPEDMGEFVDRVIAAVHELSTSGERPSGDPRDARDSGGDDT